MATRDILMYDAGGEPHNCAAAGPPIRTRFRPSANGPLHFGGAYVARQNWWCARSKGGEFILIVDDVCPTFKYGESLELTKSVRAWGDQFQRDLEWLGYAPDLTVYASEFADAHRDAAARLNITSCGYPDLPSLQRYVHSISEGTEDTYHPWLTLGRVTDDHTLGVTDFLRGGDLIGEILLYDHLARTLYGEGCRINQQYTEVIVEPATDHVCSKSDGTPGIADYREAGVTPEQINEALGKLLDVPGAYGKAAINYRQIDGDLLQVP